ncbi:MAG: substrate-binding domain-containing protein, partial [Chloroflexi bacterium]|nr:substrate-binding domain-containing protein [Chloroflexota bacterium]
MLRLSRLPPAALAIVLTAAVAALVTLALLSNVDAHPPDEGPSVRVNALRGEDGAVRVGVQVLGEDGRWGERLLPTRRVISTESPTNTWLRSSPVTIDRGGEQPPLFCVIAHGAADDHFWIKFRAFLYQSASLSNTNLRFETHLQGNDQAGAIERCIADGAAVIATTLASPDHVREPLKLAKAAEIQVITFNAGVEHARSVGSEIHIALNDRAAGELAGEQFNELGISGQVACLIHERDNLSLEHRCEGLEDAYQGSGVTRIQLEEVGSQIERDHGGYIDTLAAALVEQQGPGYDGVLALNADTLGHTLTALHQVSALGNGLLIASVGFNVDDLAEFPADWLDRHLGRLISDSADAQGFFVGGALQLSYNLHNAHVIGQPQLWLADPSLFDHQTDGGNADTFGGLSASLDRILEQYSGMQDPAAGARVRVAALKRDDGSVVFAIESIGADGRWSSHQFPQRRVLSADAPSGSWLASSVVELSSAAEKAPLFCVVTHGSKQDRYWQVARAYMHISAHVTNTNWRYEAHLDGAD